MGAQGHVMPDRTMNNDVRNAGIVVIGRNEGERLQGCLASAGTAEGRLVYVDSGSTDGA